MLKKVVCGIVAGIFFIQTLAYASVCPCTSGLGSSTAESSADAPAKVEILNKNSPDYDAAISQRSLEFLADGADISRGLIFIFNNRSYFVFPKADQDNALVAYFPNGTTKSISGLNAVKAFNKLSPELRSLQADTIVCQRLATAIFFTAFIGFGDLFYPLVVAYALICL